MFDYSSAHVGKGMAVVYSERIPEVKMVDGKEVRTTRTSEQVISVATIQSTLGREFQTTGLESMKEGADLALLLRAGALAAPMDFVDERRKLVIEVDGAFCHAALIDEAADEARTDALTAAGYRVERFTDTEIWFDPKGTVARLRTIRTGS